MIEVPLDDSPGRYVLVLRINRDDAPRPVFVQLAARFSKEKRSIFWAPIRMPGSTRPATRDELSALFVERRPGSSPAGEAAASLRWLIGQLQADRRGVLQAQLQQGLLPDVQRGTEFLRLQAEHPWFALR